MIDAIANQVDTAVDSLCRFYPDKLAIFNVLELCHVDRVYVMWDKLLRPEIIQLPFPDVSRRTLQRDMKILSKKKLLFFKGNTDQRCYSLQQFSCLIDYVRD